MALSLVLRSALRPQGLQSLCRSTPIVYNNAAKFTQLSSNSLKTMHKSLHKSGVLVEMPKRMMHDHSFMWTIEKAVSASLLAVVPLGLAFPNMILDNLMAILIAAHSHWGLEAIVIDYVRPIIVGPIIPKIALMALYLLSAMTLGGLLYFNTSNIGIGKSVHRLWKGHN